DGVPDGWTLDNGTASRDEGFGDGAFSAVLTRSSTDATLSQSMPRALVQYLTRITTQPQTVHAGAWVSSATPNIARIGIWDGASTVWSDYHPGDVRPRFLTVSRTLTDAMTD